MSVEEYDIEQEYGEISPITLTDGPLPQAGSWPLATPRAVAEQLKAARLATERQKRERGH